ncbi:hypothetical protein B0T10DRAFT_91747 [Thelonectria olida]|uniref:Uncharacterized protein n=1 Tax=Thelonectria olida TaxID=1576542 RepID=A0A9P9AMP9_9HYPO|nr:hypothetical protein B0T10DRAFT_91747 [Thelonectria olida]
MVSFFGLKIGGDKKKSHDKHNKQQATRQITHLNKTDSNISDQFANPNTTTKERRLTNNFSRPTLSRPDTASSNHAPTQQWGAPYMGGANSGAVSSMVDLAVPRAPGLGNPRFHSSDIQLNTRFASDSSTSLVPGGDLAAISPRSPTRPGTAISINTKRDWETPFGVHFAGPGSTPVSPVVGKNSLDQFEFGVANANNGAPDPTDPAGNGYPSPPPSILSADQPFSPVNPDARPGSSRRNAPSGLRNMETTGPRALPSPAASVVRTSEETWDVPVIRNVQAKRDTLTFHTPRRQSFTMEVEVEGDKGKTTPMMEGLAGNFTAFDFGETVRRGSVSQSVDSSSPTDGMLPKPFGSARTASPLRSMQSSPSFSLSTDEQRATRNRNGSDAPSALSNMSSANESIRRESPVPPSQPLVQAVVSQSGLQLQAVPVSQPVLQPSYQPSPQPSPKPPSQFSSTPQPSPKPPSQFSSTPQPSPQPPSSSHAPVKLQYHDIPASLRPAAPPPTGPIPQPPTQARSNTVPPVSAYGAHPGYMSRPLDPPPRGFRPRVDSDPRRRPNGLRVPPPLVDRSNRADSGGKGGLYSPYGPPPEEGNYMRAEPSPRPPPEARAQSPFTRTPLEGDFPVHKGLPRGRRTAALDSLAQESGGLGPRQHPRQRPMYPPPKAQPSPTETKPKNDAEEMGYTLPRWDDFDRASPHRSAIPAPLSPFRGDSQAPQTPPADDSANPSPLRQQFTSSPISPKPPSLPSPSFSSLQKSISSSSENLARSFELTNEDARPNNDQASYPRMRPPLISPVMAEFSRPMSPAMRVEAKKAPPRPTPIALPPGKSDMRAPARTPNIAVDSFSPGFI